MSRIACLLAGIAAIWGGSFATADVVVPGRRTAGRVVLPVTIRRGAIRNESGNVQAKVIIPRYLLDGALDSYREVSPKPAAKDFEAPPAKDAPADPAAAPAPELKKHAAGPAPPRAGAGVTSPYGTIVAGLAMSLAAVSLVFVIRGNKTGRTVTLALVAGGLVLGAFAVGRADVAPGRRQASPDIVIQLVDDANEVTLLLTR